MVNKLLFSDKQDPFDLITALPDIEVTSNKWQSAERHPEEDCWESPHHLLDLLNFSRCHLISIDVPNVHTVFTAPFQVFFFFYNETVLPNEIHRLIHSCYTAQLAGFLEKPLQLNYEPLIQCLFLHNVFLPTTSPLICVEHNHILTPQKGNENVGVSYRTCCSIELMQCGVSVFPFCPYP